MAIIQQAIEFARSVLSLCAQVVHRSRKPTDDEIRRICSRLLTANESDFEAAIQTLQGALRRRFGIPRSSYRHFNANDKLLAFRYVLRQQRRQPTNQPDGGVRAKEQSKARDKSAIVDDKARNERQKMSLLVEYRHILGDISKELIEDNRDLVTRTKKLIAQSKKSIGKGKSA